MGESLVPVHLRFAHAASRTPDAEALVGRAERTTYGELDARVARVRASLARRGWGPGDTVGICLSRGPDLVAVLLGVLSLGAAYVPLDPRYPLNRIEFMATDAAVAGVVTNRSALADSLTERGLVAVTVADLERDSGPAPAPVDAIDSVAYVIYTSGSTGRPKGVEVTHHNLASFLDAMTDLLPPSAAERVLFSTRLSFDIAGLELFLPLTTAGACLLAPDSWLVDARSLARLIAKRRPSLVQATPAGWRLLLDAGVETHDGQSLLCGGDTLPPSLAGRLAELPGIAYNVYGPTEATVWATAARITSNEVSIGTPLAHARAYVLDDARSPVPDGEVGELYLGGPAVARGYRGRPELTAERFLPDPWAPEPPARMYATGDLVRRVDGRLVFLRRRDTQTKLNGNRIELGEIESLATETIGVRAAVALVAAGDKPDQPDKLLLWVEADESDESLLSRLDGQLRSFLPFSMMPDEINIRSALPLTDNGKVDRKALLSAAQ